MKRHRQVKVAKDDDDIQARGGKRTFRVVDMLLRGPKAGFEKIKNPDEATKWAYQTHKMLQNRFNALLKNPADGHRPKLPKTRMGLAKGVLKDKANNKDWLGVMITDCGYETPKELIRDKTSKKYRKHDSSIIRQSRTVVWMTGKDEYGRSVTVNIEGTSPYFYVGVSLEDEAEADLKAGEYAEALYYHLNKKCERDNASRRWSSKYGGIALLGVKAVKRDWFYGYKPNSKKDKRLPNWNGKASDDDDDQIVDLLAGVSPAYQASDWYLKVTPKAPYNVNKLREWAYQWSLALEAQTRNKPIGKRWTIPTTWSATAPSDTGEDHGATLKMCIFEANVEFVLRYMIDRGLTGSGFCAINRAASEEDGLVAQLGPRLNYLKRTSSELEFTIDGAIFERAEAARDKDLTSSENPEPYKVLKNFLKNSPMRFVAREARLQPFVDGSDPNTDPMNPWFELLRDSIAPLRIVSFDIECYDPDALFPEAKRPEDAVIGICAYLYRYDRVQAWNLRRAAQMPFRKLSIALKLYNETKTHHRSLLMLNARKDPSADEVLPSKDPFLIELRESERKVKKTKQLYETALKAAEKMKGVEATLVGDGLEAVDCTAKKWPPPLDILALGLGERNPQMKGDMDRYKVQTISFASERELLLAWSQVIKVWDPDIIMGYNSVSFDMAYLFERARTLNIEHVCWKIGKFPDKMCKFREGGHSNHAKGDRVEMVADISGRIQLDIMRCRKNDVTYAPRSYKLDNVAREIIQEGKTGFKVTEIPQKQMGTKADRTEIDEYCLADAVLPIKMALAKNDIMQLVEMARVCGVPLKFLTDKGQQVRVFGQLLRKTRERNMCVPWFRGDPDHWTRAKKKKEHDQRGPWDYDPDDPDFRFRSGIMGGHRSGKPLMDIYDFMDRERRKAAMAEEDKPDKYKRVTGYEGALVLDPIAGYYPIQTKGPCGVLDYQSLYPSVMRKENICYTTVVTDPRARTLCMQTHQRLAKIYDISQQKGEQPHFHGAVMTREWERLGGWKMAPVYGDDQPARNPPFVALSVRKGILPEIEEELMTARAVAKRLMNAAEYGSAEWARQNARQNALKVSCNSVYGVTGATVGRLPNLEVSGAITAYGREALKIAIYVTEHAFEGDNQIIYGDSVTADTPIMCKYSGGSPVWRTIDSLVTWTQTNGDTKERIKPLGDDDLEVWSDKGWTAVKQVIRHKTKKRIFRILTHTGCVDVTEDHSLLNAKAERVQPKNVKLGDVLFHRNLPLPKDTPNTPEEKYKEPQTLEEKRAFAWGLFYADGSCGSYLGRNGKTSHGWSISKQNTVLLEKTRGYLNLIYATSINDKPRFKIVNHMKSSRVYRIVANGNIKELVVEFRPLFYDETRRIKKVPDCILSSSLNIRQSFWAGYYAGDGDKDNHEYVRCSNKGKIGSAGLYYLMRSIGYPVSINTRSDKPHIFRLTGTRKGKRQRRKPNTVKKIVDYGVPSVSTYVYDLETENHHFAAGVGRMVVHNTDSIMILMKDLCSHSSTKAGEPLQPEDYEALRKCRIRSKAIAKKINLLLETVHKIQFENIFSPFVLFKKKKYTALRWEEADTPMGIKSRGIESVRRDNPRMLGSLCKLFVELIVGGKKDPNNKKKYLAVVPEMELAMELLRECHRRVLADELPIESYVISQALRRKPEDYKAKMPHVDLAKRMFKRDPGSAPKPGVRIPYVIVTADSLKSATRDHIATTKLYQRSEDPEWVRDNNLKVDTTWYAINRFEKAFLRMLAPIVAPHVLNETIDETALRRPWAKTNPHKGDLAVDLAIKKRHGRAEKLVWQTVFRTNFQHQKIQKTHKSSDALVRAFGLGTKKTEVQIPDITSNYSGTDRDVIMTNEPSRFNDDWDDDDDDDDEEESIDIQKMMDNLLKDMVKTAKQNLLDATQPIVPAQFRRKQTQITNWFTSSSNSKSS